MLIVFLLLASVVRAQEIRYADNQWYVVIPSIQFNGLKHVLVLRYTAETNVAVPVIFFRCLQDKPEMENNVWVLTNPNGPGYEDDSGFEFTGCR